MMGKGTWRYPFQAVPELLERKGIFLTIKEDANWVYLVRAWSTNSVTNSWILDLSSRYSSRNWASKTLSRLSSFDKSKAGVENCRIQIRNNILALCTRDWDSTIFLPVTIGSLLERAIMDELDNALYELILASENLSESSFWASTQSSHPHLMSWGIVIIAPRSSNILMIS